MAARDLLIEIGTEELPPAALPDLSRAFEAGVVKGFEALGFEAPSCTRYATPRRLALLLKNLPERQPDQRIERRGPALKAAYDADGQPTKAALGFARSCGVELSQLTTLETDKGRWLYYETTERGRETGHLVESLVTRSLNELPVPRRMRWGAGEVEFVRPVHWVVLLFGEQVIDARVLGITAGRTTRGHRFHRPEPLELSKPGDYEALLQEHGYVIPEFGRRRDAIHRQVLAQAEALNGEVHLDREGELLDEVTALVEWPVAVSCSFDERFLRVPAEALVSTMKDNQKYFPVYASDGSLTRHFIVIANLESAEPEQVRIGNERVVRPRLADAAFFWDQDRRRGLETFNERLRDVVFQRKLGTVHEKARRVSALARAIADETDADAERAGRAGLLCKADLMSEMVFEFPQLQGIMGRYYALEDNEHPEIAQAIEEHYRPRFAGDDLPGSGAGQCVALADKLDTLVGIFAIGDRPTGVRDPFALRRAALGVLKILIEKQRDLDLEALLARAAGGFPAELSAGEAVGDVFEFMMNRLKAEYESPEQGYTPQQVASVLACRPTRPLDFDRRLRAVKAFSEMDEAETLSAANKRTANILKKSGIDNTLQVDGKRLNEPAEKALFEAIEKVAPQIEPLCRKGEYTRALQTLAGLRQPVDRFFDEVLVMADEPAVRENRLALLQRLSGLFTAIADIALLNQ